MKFIFDHYSHSVQSMVKFGVKAMHLYAGIDRNELLKAIDELDGIKEFSEIFKLLSKNF